MLQVGRRLTRGQVGTIDDMPTIWTIGYEGQAQPQVIAELQAAGIELLVDVRIRAQSRKPGFSKTSLGNGLADVGIDYVHRRALGTPLDIRGIFRAKQYDEARAAYREYLTTVAEDDLDWLAEIAQERPTAMLCFEFEAKECHRRVIAEELTARYGYEVVDLP
jgi:uncharacterized protein (DUF488 family)